ncbi:MAG: hypothetical protein M0D55_15360 [Elusimicrobiota bacterium]|nr:MAG: hypothetical protein M0D55_15360 [Elusimicrobiota bacterium]
MMTFEYSHARRQILSETLERVLSKAHVTMIREILGAEKPGRPAPRPRTSTSGCATTCPRPASASTKSCTSPTNPL